MTALVPSADELPAPAEPAFGGHVVCVGASAGGLDALERFFGACPTDTGAALPADAEEAVSREDIPADLPQVPAPTDQSVTFYDIDYRILPRTQVPDAEAAVPSSEETRQDEVPSTVDDIAVEGADAGPHDVEETVSTDAPALQAADEAARVSDQTAVVDDEALVVDGDIPASLLGMSYLGRLSGFEARPEGLTFKG